MCVFKVRIRRELCARQLDLEGQFGVGTHSPVDVRVSLHFALVLTASADALASKPAEHNHYQSASGGEEEEAKEIRYEEKEKQAKTEFASVSFFLLLTLLLGGGGGVDMSINKHRSAWISRSFEVTRGSRLEHMIHKHSYCARSGPSDQLLAAHCHTSTLLGASL
jgi:hypothetical protein